MDKPIDLFKDIDEVYQEYLLKQDKERQLYEKMNEEIEKSIIIKMH